ncbi:MAG: DNRLRE domain-containing protein [Syntrophomonadaceae bacterium]|nr:DNRLRE domain-containing protein [Syntrophomonadaceae bacterium]
MPETTFSPVQDVYIASAYPDRNFFNRTQGDVLFVGSFTNENDIYRSLLQFDLFTPYHGIPPNSSIENATLQLAMYRNDNPGVADLRVTDVLEPWNQSTVTFNNQPAVSDIGSQGVPGPAPSTVSSIVTSIVINWYNGSRPNNGFALRGLENANNNILGFRSTRFPDSRLWPSLTVRWYRGTTTFYPFEILTGAPRQSSFINMVGQEQITFLVRNETDGNLVGAVEVVQPVGVRVIDSSTAFTIPPQMERVINYSAAVRAASLNFTSAGEQGAYLVSAATHDE